MLGLMVGSIFVAVCAIIVFGGLRNEPDVPGLSLVKVMLVLAIVLALLALLVPVGK